MTNIQKQLSLFEQAQAASPVLSDEEVMACICAELLKEGGVKEPPVPMEMLASLRGISSIEAVDQPFAGMLQPAASGFEVRLRNGDSRTRQRFTIGHETGHTLLPGFFEAPQFRCNGARNWLERMCDTAAAELLLPEDLFRSHLGSANLEFEVIHELASQFEASIEATARRAVALSTHPAMLIVLSRRHKPREIARRENVAPKLRVDYCIPQGPWPFVLPHKSAADEGLGRILKGEEIDGQWNVDELFAAPIGQVRISARQLGGEGRVLALLERDE